MSVNQVLGKCDCPICGDIDGGEVRLGVKGRPYVVTECCVSMLTSSSRIGANKFRAMVKGEELPQPAAVVTVEAAPVKVVPKPEKKKTSFAEAMGL